MIVANRRSLAAFALVLFMLAALAAAQSPEEYQKRRQAVRSRMEPNSVLILRGSERTGEGPFRQESNLFYLTGTKEPGTSLILYAEASANEQQRAPGASARPKEILFWTPPGVGAAETQKPPDKPGFETVRRSAEFQVYLDRVLLGNAPVVYLDYQRSRNLSGMLTADEELLKRARDRGASFAVRPTGMLINPLRSIKSPAEIEILKTAAAITAEALKEAMRSAGPGLYEYQLQSIIEYVFSFNGAPRPGFSTIVGSGPNSCILHWSENTRQTMAGDVAVLDVGAEYWMYTADITRTIPISGTFTKRQRDIYDIVLQANQAAIEMVAPGADMRDINNRVNTIMSDGLIKLGLIKDQRGLPKYYPHGLSHPIGLQVHDVGGLGKLATGMVITIEPGLYLPEEDFGIRIEDDVVVTENGHDVITSGVPKGAQEVEALMKQGSSLNFQRYLIKGTGK
ncbi:MAG: aminopeptidase P N-terminal domain-containing protein [Acidobacteriia bacterium]|nr:aminopeptidase P N-terminal domain-containing protein [Terriglobia bacterium]